MMEGKTEIRTTASFRKEDIPDTRPHSIRLLAFDFDGTLSPLAPTPEKAELPKEIKALLLRLAEMPYTTLAVLSGRSLASVIAKTADIPGIIAFGSHGLTSNRPEFSMPEPELAYWTELCEEAVSRIKPIALKVPGVILEMKGPDLCLHYRLADQRLIPPLLAETRKRLESFPFSLKPGKLILEARPPQANKGAALLKLISSSPGCLSSGICLYAGDDETDEDAFASLRGLGERAISFKIGPGETKATHRLADTKEVERLLGYLVEASFSRKE